MFPLRAGWWHGRLSLDHIQDWNNKVEYLKLCLKVHTGYIKTDWTMDVPKVKNQNIRNIKLFAIWGCPASFPFSSSTLVSSWETASSALWIESSPGYHLPLQKVMSLILSFPLARLWAYDMNLTNHTFSEDSDPATGSPRTEKLTLGSPSPWQHAEQMLSAIKTRVLVPAPKLSEFPWPLAILKHSPLASHWFCGPLISFQLNAFLWTWVGFYCLLPRPLTQRQLIISHRWLHFSWVTGTVLLWGEGESLGKEQV